MDSGLEISALSFGSGLSGVRAPGYTIAPRPVDNADQTSFAEIVKSAGTEVVNSLNNAEAASIAGIKGDAGPYKVAAAVMEAEQNLRMTIAIREKVIQSYQEIARMQI